MAEPVSFLLWADFPAGQEDEFNEWYNREHVRDRVLGIPGFLQARRFVAVEGGPKYAALYETRGAEVFQNDAYMKMRRTPDPNSSKFVPQFRKVIRLVGPTIADATAVDGVAEGSWVRLAAYTAPPVDDEASAWSEAVAALVQRPGIMRARVARAIPQVLESAVTNMRGGVREGMRGPDRFADLMVMVEGVTEESIAGVEAEMAAAAARAGLTQLDAARMQLLMRISAP